MKTLFMVAGLLLSGHVALNAQEVKSEAEEPAFTEAQVQEFTEQLQAMLSNLDREETPAPASK